MTKPSKPALSRRQFLSLAAASGGAAALAACKKPAPEVARGEPGLSLTAEELALCTAACDRILPADEDPGAVQLGAVAYIDRRFAQTGRRILQAKRRFRKGLAQLAAWSVERTGHSFWALEAHAQDLTLASLAAEGGDEGYDFVRQLAMLTMEGAFSDPAHGGNRDGAGWKLIGFPARSAQCR